MESCNDSIGHCAVQAPQHQFPRPWRPHPALCTPLYRTSHTIQLHVLLFGQGRLCNVVSAAQRLAHSKAAVVHMQQRAKALFKMTVNQRWAMRSTHRLVSAPHCCWSRIGIAASTVTMLLEMKIPCWP